MGADGSKQKNKTLDMGQYNWLSQDEQIILEKWINNLVPQNTQASPTSRPSINYSKLQVEISNTTGDECADKFIKLLQSRKMRGLTAGRGMGGTGKVAAGETKGGTITSTSVSCHELTGLLVSLLDPDYIVQTEVVMALAGGSYNGNISCSKGSNDSSDSNEHTVSSVLLCDFVAMMIKGYCGLQHHDGCRGNKKHAEGGADGLGKVRGDGGGGWAAVENKVKAQKVAEAWLHNVLFDGVTEKKSYGKTALEKKLTAATVQRWFSSQTGCYTEVQHAVLKHLAAPTLTLPPSLLPAITMDKTGPLPSLSGPEVLMLNTALPLPLRCRWRLLFHNHQHGDSFQVLLGKVVNAGPTLVVVEGEDGCVFGGFAAGAWEVRPQFHGSSECFLFSVRPQAGVYRSTGFNTNYQYLNYLPDNTMPNGMGMGGREELFGFFLSAEFGNVTVSPTCSTFHSPPLSPSLSPALHSLSVWGVGEEPVNDSDDDEEGGVRKKRSALDSNADARALLDMLGRTQISAGLRTPETDSD